MSLELLKELHEHDENRTVRCERGHDAQLVTGFDIYPHRRDLADKDFWICMQCRAWVGCHKGTTRPLGSLADAATRNARQLAHAAFDPLWQAAVMKGRTKQEARTAAYHWLAEQLAIDPADCHIGQMTVEQCGEVARICLPHRRRLQLD